MNSKLQPLQLFLHRNLSYVRFRKWRGKKVKRRSCGKLHSISLTVDKLVERKRGAKHYMTFTFHGFHCNDVTADKRFAEVQLIHKETDTMVRLVGLLLTHQHHFIFCFFFAVNDNHCGCESARKSPESTGCRQYAYRTSRDNMCRWKITGNFVVHRQIQSETTGWLFFAWMLRNGTATIQRSVAWTY